MVCVPARLATNCIRQRILCASRVFIYIRDVCLNYFLRETALTFCLDLLALLYDMIWVWNISQRKYNFRVLNILE